MIKNQNYQMIKSGDCSMQQPHRLRYSVTTPTASLTSSVARSSAPLLVSPLHEGAASHCPGPWDVTRTQLQMNDASIVQPAKQKYLEPPCM